ncbi:MAG TPA: cation diffusion facilitator family transporter [Thauera sp.]|uniref:cation diffusion facilitator family transporter n=1 Tax=Thauera sp. TaxID=1905334 RepID=UPI002C3B5381|nr:cation diffusion facilitator family transporter [Thauera sp.]HRP24533.1 cation diffusion facilitator family transporter [Thauera sp.]HRP66422.1 cation diffusion facilitator family transporter [Thauera sp.]
MPKAYGQEHHEDHDHDHGHGHGHPHRSHEHGHQHHHHDHSASRFLPLALALTLGFAAVEAIAGWWSGSLALLGDAGHMLTDAMSLGLAAIAARVALRAPSHRHSYGLRRVEALAALVNSLLMLAVVGGLVWHAIDRLLEPRPILGEAVIVVALGGLVLNLVVAWLLTRGEADLNTRGALLHVMGDLLGSVAALASGLVIQFSGWTPIDPLLTMLICGLILFSTMSLLRRVVHTLLEGVPEGVSLPDVGRAMAAVPDVRSVHDLHIWSLDSRRTALSAHVVLADARRWPTVLAALRTMLQERFGIEHVTLQPELPPAQPLVFSPRAPRGRSAEG